MRVGIIGLPATGKTTVFNALTRGKTPVAEFGGKRSEANIGTIAVPDRRFDHIVRVCSPKKVSPANIEVIDGAAPIGIESQRDFGTDFFAGIRAVEALIHVVRAFDSPMIPPPERGLNPLRDVRKVNDELMLADLTLVETRLERVRKGLQNKKIVPGSPQTMELELLERIMGHLEDGLALKDLQLSPDEVRLIKSFDFLTLKPMIVVANVAEEKSAADDSLTAGLSTYCEGEGLELIELAAGVEMEVAQLPEGEQIEYLQAMGIQEPARNRVVRSAYRALGLIAFFTSGEDEVRAWTVDQGAKAVEAAGKIHSDLARGFIRAEIVSYRDFEESGSWDAAKNGGMMRLETKDYVIRDGDIMVVRFKV